MLHYTFSLLGHGFRGDLAVPGLYGASSSSDEDLYVITSVGLGEDGPEAIRVSSDGAA